MGGGPSAQPRAQPRGPLRRTLPTLTGLTAVAVGIDLSARNPSWLYALYVGVSLLLGAVAATTLVWMIDAWRTPDSLDESRFDDTALEPAYSFSLIVPARHEESVLETTLGRLVDSEHPAFEVLVVVGADDAATLEVAERVALRHPDVVKVVIDTSWPKNKPKALNAALPHCSGTITGVFDAEDDVHPALLRRVDQCFQRTHADVVQAGVQLMNFRSSWLTVHNVLEYYFWFRSRLHLHARQRFIPLGGNTVFIRTPVLRAAAGWDPECLAEDCELGVRLSALGAHTAVFYEPELVTREECPPTLGAFVRQRTRWNQGYLQTLSRGYWRRLPFRQRVLGAYVLATPFLMALAWVLIPVSIVTAVSVKAPVPLALVSFMPALPMLTMLVVQLAGLGEFCRMYGERARVRDYARLVFGLLVYQAVLTFAAARAVARQVRGVVVWEKTAHLGLHLGLHLDVVTDRADPAEGHRGELRRLPAPQGQPVVTGLSGAGTRLLANDAVLRRASSQRSTTTDAEAPTRLGGIEAAGGPPGQGRPDSGTAPQGVVAGRAAASTALAVEHLFGAVGGEPLWVRLDGVSAAGPSAVALPSLPPIDLPGADRLRLAGLRAVLRRVVSARVDLAVQVPLLIVVGLVQATNMFNWPGISFDEGTYVSFAWAVGERGTLANYTYTYGHPPLAWLAIAAWTWASGLFGHATYSVDTARELMCAVTIVGSWLLYHLARRLQMGPGPAAGAVALFAFSPLALFFHRASLLDNPATVWALAAFVLALSPRRSLWSFAASGACFAASVLSKETTLVMLPALLVAGYQNTDVRTRRYCVGLLAAFSLLIGMAFPLYATLKGELVPGPGHVSLLGTDVNMLFTRKGTGDIFNVHSGTYGTVASWMHLDPWLPGAALVLSPIALARRSTRAIALCFLIQVAMILRTGYLPEMYVIAQLPFAALIVVGGMQAIWCFAQDAGHRRRPPSGQVWWRALAGHAAAMLRQAALAGAALTVVATAAGAALYVAPAWARADRVAMTVALDRPELAAEKWLVGHVSHTQRLIVTDDFWIYLIVHGFNSQPMKGGFNSKTVVSYWPLDKDPAVRRAFPYSWREFDYVVSTPAMRSTANNTPSTLQALAHSRIVAAFGVGAQRIAIRAIIPTPLGTGASAGAPAYETPPASAAPSLDQVARLLGVKVRDLVTHTNQRAEPPAWWYYEARHRYGAPLPGGMTLDYASPPRARFVGSRKTCMLARPLAPVCR